MQTKIEKIKVIYRKWNENEVIALMPEIPEDRYGLSFRSYMHIGQHGAAEDEIIQDTTPATPEEYADLHAELQSIYENDPDNPCKLVICKRITRTMYLTRRDSANNYWQR